MKYEITSKKEFQIEAAKALLADGQPHSYAEIVQHIRSQAEGTVLEGRIDYGNVWYSLRSMMEEPGSHYGLFRRKDNGQLPVFQRETQAMDSPQMGGM